MGELTRYALLFLLYDHQQGRFEAGNEERASTQQRSSSAGCKKHAVAALEDANLVIKECFWQVKRESKQRKELPPKIDCRVTGEHLQRMIQYM